MIHTFKFDNRFFAYDVFSSSLMEVDEATHNVIDLYSKGHNEQSIHERLDARFDVQAVNEILFEIEELKKSGSFDSEINYASCEPSTDFHIKALCLHIAHDCNLRCKYCFASTGAFGGKRELMSEAVGLKALDLLFANSGKTKNLEVDFFGGEPMMNFDVVKAIVRHGRELEKKYNKHVNFTMTTNCYDISEEAMEYLNEEMHNIVISLDGREDKHNFMRPTAEKTGSHSVILENAKKFVKMRGDKSHYIRGTFTKHNLDFSEDVKYLHSQGFKQISVEPVVADEKLSYAITEDDLPQIFSEYEKLAKWYIKERAKGRWLNFFHFFVDLETGPCVTKRLSGCGAGCEYLAVAPSGEIYPCHQFAGQEDFLLGNLNDGITNMDIRSSFASNQVSSKDDCRNCWAQMFCGGGCSANAYNFNGTIAKPHLLECEMQRKRLECALAIYALEHMTDKKI
ncbi:MAG: thioether cross-link-forming SCIFF peptide maturase [Clostridia bacterium]|nr:thioether cross-link-forming SCIFF peptide maturase [Clostridia bacterium]